jgi:SAM-dependent methyltransferase
MKHGDFTDLADNYAEYRPAYSPFVRNAIAGLLPMGAKAADIGAGTGIWAQMLFEAGCRVDAVEPNDAMRRAGVEKRPNLHWFDGSAEDTGLSTGQYDLVSMASSFHWPDFNRAVAEFGRLLKPSGYFTALWNTRNIAGNALLEDIEETLHTMLPGLKRVSSGRSKFTDSLTDRLQRCGIFDEVMYMEGNHTEQQTPKRYCGLWESVNDIRVQAGEEKFQQFIHYIYRKTQDTDHIHAKYSTRVWIARRID